MKWLQKHYPFYYERMSHTPNEGRVSIVEAMELKRMGLKSGEADYRMAFANADYYSFNMEVKKEHIFGQPKAAISKTQRHRGEIMREDGNCFEFCYGLAQMIEAFLLYINNDPDMKLQSAKYTKRYKRLHGEL